MIRRFRIILFVGLFVALSYSVSQAQFIADSPFTTSYVQVIPNIDGLGNSAVITYESTDYLGSYFAFLIDPSGVPIATQLTYGWVYLFGDTAPDGSIAIYGSNTGFYYDWVRIF